MTAAVRVLVLPVPAPARTRTGPVASAASSCCSVKSERAACRSATSLLDFNMAVVSMADEDFLVGCEQGEIRVEVPRAVRVALAVYHHSLCELGAVMRLRDDVGVGQAVARERPGGPAPLAWR